MCNINMKKKWFERWICVKTMSSASRFSGRLSSNVVVNNAWSDCRLYQKKRCFITDDLPEKVHSTKISQFCLCIEHRTTVINSESKRLIKLIELTEKRLCLQPFDSTLVTTYDLYICIFIFQNKRNCPLILTQERN